MLELVQNLVKRVYNVDALNAFNEVLQDTLSCSSKEEKECFLKGIRDCLDEIQVMSDYYRIYLLSILIAYEEKKEDVVKVLAAAKESTELTKENKYYLIRQLDRIAFKKPYLWSQKASAQIKELYDDLFEVYQEVLAPFLKPIAKEERNQNIVVVFTTQFLGIRHAPTHSTVERCYYLQKELGKQVLLINTREVTNCGQMLFCNAEEPGLEPQFSEFNDLTYKDCKIDFFQPDVPMPDIGVLQVILQMIQEIKPWFVLGMGDYSITADLSSKIVPMAALSFGFSVLPASHSKMSILGRQLFTGEKQRLMKAGYQEGEIIESTFTFELHPQKKNLTRADLGLPEDKFLLVIIGTRLHFDVTDEFVKRMIETFSWNTHLVFVGIMDNYEQMCKEYSLLAEHSTFLGYQDDILAVVENCDLYVNPKRMGGGFSIIECFYKGVPGVTISYGDVAAAAGSDFWVEDYDEMLKVIRQYVTDKEFYQNQVKNGRKRLEVVLDGAKATREMVTAIENNPNFF